MHRSHFKIAFRQLWRNRTYSLLNIFGLALGMACCLLIGLYVHDEWSHDRFHAHYRHIYRVTEKQRQPDGIFDVAVTPAPLAPALARDFAQVEQAVRVGSWMGLLTHGRQALEAERMLIVDAGFFTLFSFPLLAGDVRTVFRQPNEVVLSEAAAVRLFGARWREQDILGRTVMLDKQQPLRLAGVAANPPVRSHIQFDVLLPFKWVERNDPWNLKWNSNSYHTYLQLRPYPDGSPADAAVFGARISGLLKHYDAGNETKLLLQPLSGIYLHSKFAFDTDFGKRSDIAYVRIFVAVGLIVLLVAVVNFINLATARASQRAKEVGVRKTVGAQRGGLVAQFLGEALLLVSLAVGAALVLAQALLPVFNGIAAKSLRIPYHLPAFWLVLAVFSGLVGVLSGLYPAFFLSAFRPALVLKGVVAVSSGRRFRQSLVVGQFVMAVSLVIGTVVIYRQLAYMQHTRLGFDKSHLLHMRLKGDLRAKALLLKTEVLRLPGVASAAVATSNLVDVVNGGGIEWEGQVPKDEFLITQMNVDADFMPTTGMSLAAGRNFSARIPSDTSSVRGAYLLNETAARRMGWTPASALGKTIKFWGLEGKVVGVLRDFHFRPLRVGIEPFIFRYQPKEFYFTLLVKTRPGGVSRTLAQLAASYKKLNPDNPISYGFVDQDLDKQYRAEQQVGRIIGCFSILTILVSCLGLFGLAAFTVEVRTKEVGIRKVLGARVSQIVLLLSKDFLKLVLLAFVIAIPVSWWAMHRWLQDFAYRIDISWWIFALAGFTAVAVALLTVSFQAVKAALADPVKSLRSE